MPSKLLHGRAVPFALLAALFGLGCSVAPPIRSTEIANQSDATIEINLTGKDRDQSVQATLKPGCSVHISGEFHFGEIRSGNRVLTRVKPFDSTYTVNGPADEPTVDLEPERARSPSDRSEQRREHFSRCEAAANISKNTR
jgi:hypothetical protein